MCVSVYVHVMKHQLTQGCNLVVGVSFLLLKDDEYRYQIKRKTRHHAAMMQLVLRLQTLADSDEDAIAQARLAGRICRHPMRIPQTVRELHN